VTTATAGGRLHPSVWLLVAAIAIVAGLLLREQQLALQIVLDDEWHSLHKLLTAGPLDIATHYGYADYSIPLTLYERFLFDHGGLSELRMRAPVFAAGALMLVLFPWLVRDCTDWPTRGIFVLLLALSPLLVLYSRHARPYALTCLLTFTALVAFDRWWRREGRPKGSAVAYVGATFLGGWLSPITLPFTLGPFAFHGLAALGAVLSRQTRRDALARIARLAVLAVVTAVPLAAAILPPLLVDWTQFSAKAGAQWVTPASLWRALLLQFGVGASWIGAALLAIAVLGVVQFWRTHRAQVACFAFVAAAALAAIIATRPEWIHHPGVLARYMIPMLPALLLVTSRGAASLLQRVRLPGAAPALAIALGIGLFFAGPLPAQLSYPTQFGAHLRYWFDFDSAMNPYVTLQPRESVPAFYRELAELPPGSRVLVEAPWRLESHYNPLALYQQVHRQLVRVGFVTPVCGTRTFGEYPEGTGMRMRHFAQLPALLRGDTGGADYLVMHLKPWTTPPDVKIDWPDVAGCLPAIEDKLGPPVYRDARIVVYPLKPERRTAR
jgi:hypothetical protein